MTVIYLSEYNTRCCGVFFEINGCIRVEKYKDISDHGQNLLCVKTHKNIFG